MIQLWEYFLHDNLDAFHRLVANAISGLGPQSGSTYYKVDGSVLPSTSPRPTAVKTRESLENTPKTSRIVGKPDQQSHQIILNRAQVNAKDAFGRTLLHHAATSSRSTAFGFTQALLQIPSIDLYAQDLESGWTPLHRALYHGHVRTAQALMLRDVNDLNGHTKNAFHQPVEGLIKIKDHEGNTPFDLFALTVASRDLQHSSLPLPTLDPEDIHSIHSADADGSDTASRTSRSFLVSRIQLSGDELFAFGSNKNFNLGVGDEDDRQFPAQATLGRPQQLLRRLHADLQARRARQCTSQESMSRQSNNDGAPLPATVMYKPIVIQDVVMSKLHTAVMTDDASCNVYVCGYGPGGRLGTGDESTRFGYVCLENGGLSKRHVVAMALGQDHSIAVCEQGEVFTWGSNQWGQLGYASSGSPADTEGYPRQLTPRQLFGSIKKEVMIGAAASSLHSVIFSSSAIYTFGKNEGQLGLMDAEARSLEKQILPRRVGVSILQSPVLLVTAIDRATAVLLETREVMVLTHYGWTRLTFQLEGFANLSLHTSTTARRHTTGHYGRNLISKIMSGGNTICAMSTFGEVFTVDVSKKPDSSTSKQSTTNPSKARNALPQPAKLWSAAKSGMAASDVAVGQDGSIILCTAAGSVWRKEKRAKVKQVNLRGPAIRKGDYKFARIPNLDRAIGVRSNIHGAYAVIRKDCDVTRRQIIVDPQTLWDTLFTMLPFRSVVSSTGETADNQSREFRFWTPSTPISSPSHVRKTILLSNDIESQISTLLQKFQPLADSHYDLWIASTSNEIRIPVHSFLIRARSTVLRSALVAFQKTYYFSIPEVLSIEYGLDGDVYVRFEKTDVLTMLNYVFYLYTDNLIDVWHHTQQRPRMASRYRQVRTELMKVGNQLGMKGLEHAARVMIEPVRCLHVDMEMALRDPDFFTDTDVSISLADGAEMAAHQELLSRRCPFFEGLFDGRARGLWLKSRRDDLEGDSDVVRVDLKHVEERIFSIVLRHLYADTGEELFDDVLAADLDEFLDVVFEVMAVSNELMLDRLTQICQQVLGQHVTIRNVCQLLNAVAPCLVDEFKRAGLEYICLNLETMLEQRLLEELDCDLLKELDEMVQENQLACLPYAKSGRAEAELLEQYPQLATQIEQSKQGIIDSLRFRSQMPDSEGRIRSGQKKREETSRSSGTGLGSLGSKESLTGAVPASGPKAVSVHREQGPQMVFEMDEESPLQNMAGSSPRFPQNTQQWVEDAALHGSASPSYQGHLWRSARAMSEDPNTISSTSRSFSLRNGPSINSVGGESFGNDVAAAPGAATADKPWQQTLAGSRKTDLKSIMATATASRTSNLTFAINQGPTATAVPKLSQRQRKKMQQERSQEEGISSPLGGINVSEPSVLSSTPTSPWQAIEKGSKASNQQQRRPDHATSPQAIPRPAMTMRQTLAGGASTSDRDSTRTSSSQLRSVSMPINGSLSTPKPQIQSIRHSPATTTTPNSLATSPYSMAEILAQQRGEKVAIKEAAAKRSLQEIQEEQEFQEWWDHESKKVQEQESVSTPTASRSRACKTRGGRRGASRGASKPSTSDGGAGGRKRGTEISGRSQTGATRDR